MVIIPMVSGVPADASVNTWHFDMPATGPTDVDDVHVKLRAFYDGILGLYGSGVAQNGLKSKWYNLGDAKPRVPFAEKTWNWPTGPSGAWGANELAICLSFQGARVSGLNQARRRGRIYIGPVDNAHYDQGRIQSSAVTTLVAAATTFLTASKNSTTWKWVVHSVKNAEGVPGGGDFDADVTDGWVDNAVDIQRRRGLAPTTRTVF